MVNRTALGVGAPAQDNIAAATKNMGNHLTQARLQRHQQRDNNLRRLAWAQQQGHHRAALEALRGLWRSITCAQCADAAGQAVHQARWQQLGCTA